MRPLPPTKFLIDGIDRLGKSSLVKKIQDEFGYHLVVHYEKPKLLELYVNQANHIDTVVSIGQSPHSLAYQMYQEETNRNMFKLMRTDVPMIFDRTHLGEMVYAPLYRKYSGEYVYDMEMEFIQDKPYTVHDNVRLILLTTSNFEMLSDDGLSFDPSKKEDEQKMFVDAFNRSKLPNKVVVDVHDNRGGFKTFDEVFMEAMYSGQLSFFSQK